MEDIFNLVEPDHFKKYFKENSKSVIFLVGEWSIDGRTLGDIFAKFGIERVHYTTFRSYAKLANSLHIGNVNKNANVVSVLFGPVPHKNPSASIFAGLQEGLNEMMDNYPPFIKLATESHQLKITKHSLVVGLKILYDRLFPIAAPVLA